MKGQNLRRAVHLKRTALTQFHTERSSGGQIFLFFKGNLDTRDLCAISKFLKIGNSFLLLFIFHGAKEKMMLKWIEHCVLPVGDP